MQPPALSRAVLGQVQPARFWQPQRSESGPMGEVRGQVSALRKLAQSVSQTAQRSKGLLCWQEGKREEDGWGRKGKGEQVSTLGASVDVRGDPVSRPLGLGVGIEAPPAHPIPAPALDVRKRQTSRAIQLSYKSLLPGWQKSIKRDFLGL